MLENDEEFGYTYKFFKLYKTCLQLTATNQYKRSRKIFFDSLSWFSMMFDETFVQRSHDIKQKYESKEYRDLYTYEQIEQLKYIRIVIEFSRMVIDASSKNRVLINRDPNRRVELVPVGYGMVISYEQISTELYNKLNQVQKFAQPKDVIKFFNHNLAWFGGIFDASFILEGYLIGQREASPEMRYRQLLVAFTKMLSRCGITPAPMASLVYKPTWTPPYSVEDVVKAKKYVSEEMSESWHQDFIINTTY